MASDPAALPLQASLRNEGEAASPAASDEELMARFCEGDAQAFDQLFGRYCQPLHGYFLHMARDRSAADDLLQATFLHLVKARGRFNPSERLAPWLYAIARNAGRDYLRLARHRSEAPPLGPDEEPAQAPAEGGPEPAEVKALREALDALPAPQREAVVMHQLQGLSFPEIAVVLGTTPGAAKVRAHRGYQKLRELLVRLRGPTP